MTQPAPVPPMDAANTLLTPGPAQLCLGLVQTSDGQRLALTVRTGSTTQTVFLTKDDADLWSENIRVAAGKMSRLIVASGSMKLPAMPG